MWALKITVLLILLMLIAVCVVLLWCSISHLTDVVKPNSEENRDKKP